MELSNHSIERMCIIFGYLQHLESRGISFVSSRDLAKAAGATEYTIRKDISLLDMTGYTRKGYPVIEFKNKLGEKLHLNYTQKACIVGLGRLGTALLDYKKFEEDGFNIVAGFDDSINKLERIRTAIDVYPVTQLEAIVRDRGIKLGIIAVPAERAQFVADLLVKAGVNGILNFSTMKIDVPTEIIYKDMDFTNALRFIAARFSQQTHKTRKG